MLKYQIFDDLFCNHGETQQFDQSRQIIEFKYQL